MKLLPIYPSPPGTPVGPGQPRDPNCRECALGQAERAATPCLPSKLADPGGVFVVLPPPAKEEDCVGEIGTSFRNAEVLKLLRSRTKSLHVAPATRCWNNEVEPAHADACRRYLEHDLQQAKPERVLCFGSIAARAVLGRSIQPISARRGWARLEDGTPVFVLFSPYEAEQNKIVRHWLLADLLWALSVTPATPPFHREYVEVDTAEQAEEAVESLYDHRADIIFDVETAGQLFSDWFKIQCCGVVSRAGGPVYVWTAKAFDDPKALAPLREILLDRSVGKGGQNVKYDICAFFSDIRPHVSCEVRNVTVDTMIWRWQLNTEADKGLDDLAELVGMGGSKQEMEEGLIEARSLISKHRELAARGLQHVPGFAPEVLDQAVMRPHLDINAFAYGLVDRDVTHRYVARDVLVTAVVADYLEGPLRASEPLWAAWTELHAPALEALVQVERWGFAAKREDALRYGAYLHRLIEQLRPRMMQWGEFDPNSPVSIATHLYETLRLPIMKRTKTGAASTDAKTLKGLKQYHPLIPLLLEYRELEKMRGTYAEGMLPFILQDGRVHPTVRQVGTRSARFSMADPNLQQIPSRAGLITKMAKDIFYAPPGRVLVQLDFSQLEYRVVAILADDPVFKKIFVDGHDLHRRTFELVAPIAWAIPTEKAEKFSDDEAKDYRRFAKIVNFGLLYGMQDKALAELLNCSVQVAGKIRIAVLGLFDRTRAWLDEQVQLALQTGVTWTYIDGKKCHRRNLYKIVSSDFKSANRARNASFNTPVQGTAAHFCERSLIKVVNWIKKSRIDAKLVNTVHDSLVFEVGVHCVDEVVTTAKGIMENWPSFGVPIVADAEVGWTWGALYDYTEYKDTVALLRAGADPDDVMKSMAGVLHSDGPLDEAKQAKVERYRKLVQNVRRDLEGNG